MKNLLSISQIALILLPIAVTFYMTFEAMSHTQTAVLGTILAMH